MENRLRGLGDAPGRRERKVFAWTGDFVFVRRLLSLFEGECEGRMEGESFGKEWEVAVVMEVLSLYFSSIFIFLYPILA